MNFMKRTQRRGGYSVTELMVTVAIIATMAAVAVPNMRGRAPTYWLDHTTSSVQSELLRARMQALSQGVDVRVSLTELGEKVRVRKEADWDDSGTIEGDEQTDVLIDYADLLTITLPGAEAVFQADGSFTSTDSNWHVHLKNSDLAERFVYIFDGGHVQTVTTAM